MYLIYTSLSFLVMCVVQIHIILLLTLLEGLNILSSILALWEDSVLACVCCIGNTFT